MDNIQAADVIAAYIKARDARDELARRHKEELKPYNERLQKFEAWLQRKLLADKLQNLSTADAVAFLKTATSVTVNDWDATLGFILERGAHDLLERRVSKSAYEDYEREGIIVPGVAVSRVLKVHVQRK